MVKLLRRRARKLLHRRCGVGVQPLSGFGQVDTARGALHHAPVYLCPVNRMRCGRSCCTPAANADRCTETLLFYG